MKCFALYWIAILALLPSALRSNPAVAHEFWIEPRDFTVEVGGSIVADLKFGQKLKGDVYPYFKSKFLAYTITRRGEQQEIRNPEGESPSVNIKALEPGLAVIAYYSIAERAAFEDWNQVLAYLELEGNTWVANAHLERGLDGSKFTEAYSRCAKALVQIGVASGADQDHPVGMPLELVAGKNPYASEPLAEMPVVLLWQGKPAAGLQVSVFQQNDELTELRLRTDEGGRVNVPLTRGGMFLLNAVRMQAAPRERNTQWESHWASLTFWVPPQGN